MKWSGKRVLVTGGNGFIGRTLVPELQRRNADVYIPRTREFDLTTDSGAERLFKIHPADIVIHLAADAGGISYLQSHPASIFVTNVLMNVHVLEQCIRHSVGLFIGVNTVAAYPASSTSPLREEDVFLGPPQSAWRGYGLAKQMMLHHTAFCRDQYGLKSVNVILDNVYGPHDSFNREKARVIPANIRRFVEAAEQRIPSVSCWGSGEARRDFLHVEDAVRGIFFVAENAADPDPMNIGSGNPITIKALVTLIAKHVPYQGAITWDNSRPEGSLNRYMNIEKANKIGFSPVISLAEGIKRTITWFRENCKSE